MDPRSVGTSSRPDDAASKPAVDEVRAYVGLGSNLGDRTRNLRRALDALGACSGITVVRASSFIETEPVGGPPEQGKFLNAAAALDTSLSPRELLRACQEIERSLGRTREVRWGPRTIDIDILLYGEEIVKEPDLEIPHPRMHERLFVLLPLVEIASGARHPVYGKTMHRLLGFLGMTEELEDPATREALFKSALDSGDN